MADRQYELVYILPPDTSEQQVTDLHGQIEAVGRTADAAELFVAEGIAPVMNRFNRKEDGD